MSWPEYQNAEGGSVKRIVKVKANVIHHHPSTKSAIVS